MGGADFPREPGSAEEVRKAIDRIDDGFVVFDLDWRILYLNRSAEEYFGRKREELKGHVIWELMPLAAGTELERALRDAAAQHEPSELESFVPTMKRWVAFRVFPWEQGVSIWFRDVTEHKRAEDRLQLIADAGGVLGQSLDSKTIFADLTRLVVPRLADYCGVELIEDGSLHRVAASELGAANKSALIDTTTSCASVARTGEPELLSVDDASLLVVPIKAREKTLGVLCLFFIGARRRYAAADLATARAIADRAGLAIENARLHEQTIEEKHLRDEVLGIVSHDLRNPLGAILAGARLLGHRIAAPEISSITRSVKFANTLIQDLLTASALEARALPLEKRWLSAGSVVEEAISLVRSIADERAIVLESYVEPDLPFVFADRRRIVQVMNNLLGNALKFSSSGGRVRVEVREGEGSVLISVSDSGPGIAPDALSHVFDRFWQGARARRAGAGLGLSIAKGIVEAHGGVIDVESVVGQGATFRFTLPAGDTEES